MEKYIGRLKQLFAGLVFVAASLMGAAGAFAHPIDLVMQLQSESLGEERSFEVSLPSGYHEGEALHPVIVVLDGVDHLAHIREAASLRYQSGLPDPIIVSVHSVDRLRDFTFVSSEEAPQGGAASNFISFLVDELIPLIQKDYRTSHHISLFGHSAGGLLGVQAFIERPNVFSAMILVSPTVRWADFALLDGLPEALARTHNLQRLHLSWGNETGLEREGFIRLREILENNVNSPNTVVRQHENENHISIPYLAAFEGLRTIYAPFEVTAAEFDQDPISAIEAYFESISLEFGMSPIPPQRLLLNRGAGQRSAGNFAQAIETFYYFSEVYPGNPMPRIQLARTYEVAGDLQKALETYRISAELMIWPPDLPDRIARLETLLEQ